MTLTELYETYENKLRRYAASLARDPHWAEDLVQDTFVYNRVILNIVARDITGFGIQQALIAGPVR